MAKRVIMKARGLGAQLLDMLFPPRCQACRQFSLDPLCETCRDAIEFIDGSACPCCGVPLSDERPECLPGGLCAECRGGRLISAVRSAGLHTGTLREAIIAYKFDGRRQLAEAFAEMLAEVVGSEIDPKTGPGLPLDLCEALVPVPLHPKRRRWRGFDQAELLSAELAERLGMPLWNDALARVRDTRPQTRLSGASRRRNVRGAFDVRTPWRLKDRSVVLVDDVFTTGATLDECALVLKRAGAAAVYGLTVSRGVPAWRQVVVGAPAAEQGADG